MNLAEGRVHINLSIVIIEIVVNMIFINVVVDNITAINMFYSLSISYGVGSLLHIVDRIYYNKRKENNPRSLLDS